MRQILLLLARQTALCPLLLLAALPAAAVVPDFRLPLEVTFRGGQIVLDATDVNGLGAGTVLIFRLKRPDGYIGSYTTETDENGRFVIALDAAGLADRDAILITISRNVTTNLWISTVRSHPGSPSNDVPRPWNPAFSPNLNVQAGICAGETCGAAGPCTSFSADLFTHSNEPTDSGVSLADGTVLTHLPVLSFATRRMGFDLRLHHQSMTDSAGPVGNGWSHSFNMAVVQTGATAGAILTPDLRVFPVAGGGGATVGTDEWTLPEGFFSRLRRDATLNRWILTHHTGVRFQFLIGAQGLPGPLIQIDDTNGNHTLAHLDPSGFLSSVETDLGQRVTFEYDGNGRLAAVADPLARRWTFAHDALGNLTAVGSPATETADVAPGREITGADLPAAVASRVRTTILVYADPAFPSFLTRVLDPRTAEVRGYSYHHSPAVTAADPDVGRVETVRINGRPVTFLYRLPADAKPIPKPVLEAGNSIVRVIDREANVTDYEIQGPRTGLIDGQGAYGLRRRLQWTERGKGNPPLRPGGGTTVGGNAGEPDAWETRWLHDCDCLSPIAASQPFRSDAPPQLDEHKMPVDFPIELFTYNDRRQVLAWELRGGAGESIRWTKTYDTFERFSRLLTYTEPRAFDAGSLYAGLAFTHRYEYDGNGNLTAQGAPTVTRGQGGPQPIRETWAYNASGQMLSHRDANGNLTLYTYFEGPSLGGNVNTRGAFGGYLAAVTRGAQGSAGWPLNLMTRFRVNALGWVTERRDPNGFYYVSEYDALGEKTKEIEPEVSLDNGGHVQYETRFVHDAAGNPVLGRRSNIDFDGTVPANDFIDRSRSFDAIGNLLSERVETDADPAHDLTTRYAYDGNDQRSIVQKPEGNRTFMVYDERRLLFRTFAGVAPGQTVADSYPINKRQGDLGGTSFVGLSTVVYDARGNAVEHKDGRGNVSRSFFDFANRSVATLDPNGFGQASVFDAASNVMTEERGAVSESGTIAQPLERTYFRYDEAGRPYETVRDVDAASDESAAVDPDDGRNSAWRTGFDPGGRPVRRLDAEGHATTTVYDAVNRIAETVDALGNTRSLSYDYNSNVILENDFEVPGPGATGQTELYSFCFNFDALNRRTYSSVHGLNGTALDQVTSFDYDSRNNIRRTEDPEGNFSLSTFDDQDRLIRFQRFAKAGTELARQEHVYDRNGNTLEDTAFQDVTNPASAEVTRYAYDALDRRLRTIYPDAGMVATTYDANSNPTGVTEQRGVRFTNTYDPGNRLTQQEIALPSGVPGETERDYSYDSLNRLVQASNDFSQVLRGYDPLSRLTSETQEIRLSGEGDYKEPIQLQYAFDRQGNRTAMQVLDGALSDLAEIRVHDALNRVQSISAQTFADSRFQPVASYAFIGPTRLQSKTLGNGAFLTESYDGKPRLARHVWQAPGGVLLAGFEYAYDDVDNILSERYLHDGGRYDNFGYDPRYEVTGASFRQSSPVDYRSFAGDFRDQFQYDDVFNRTQADFGGPLDSQTTTSDRYQANSTNEYTEITRNGHRFEPVYDAAGNATELPVRPVSGPEAGHDVAAVAIYDAFNHLFEIQAGGNPKQHYYYDPFGRRIATLELGGATAGPQILAGSRRFLYDHWTDVEERLFKQNAALSESSSTLERVYVHGPRIDELLLTAVDGNLDGKISGVTTNSKNTPGGPDWEYYALDNRLGSVMALLDRDQPGRVLEAYRYDAFGQPSVLASVVTSASALSPAINPFLFTGRRLDGKTGSYEYRMRNMEPVSGLFLQRDPVGWEIDQPSAGNLYSYAADNPVNFVDPLGDLVITIGPCKFEIFCYIDLSGNRVCGAHFKCNWDTWFNASEPFVEHLLTPYIPVPPAVRSTGTDSIASALSILTSEPRSMNMVLPFDNLVGDLRGRTCKSTPSGCEDTGCRRSGGHCSAGCSCVAIGFDGGGELTEIHLNGPCTSPMPLASRGGCDAGCDDEIALCGLSLKCSIRYINCLRRCKVAYPFANSFADTISLSF
jgi:RHS repeat-associated protein